MATATAAWKAKDGTLYEAEDDAKAHDFEAEFREWVRNSCWSGQDGDFSPVIGRFVDQIITDRMKLLSIFKLLNGGSPLSKTPSRESAL